MTHQAQPSSIQETATLAYPPVLPVVIEHTAQALYASFSEKMKQALNGRQDRALKLALEGHVTHKASRIYSVISEDGRHAYLVDLDRSFCTCPDSQSGKVCKHRLAAYLIEQSQKAHPNETIPPAEPEPDHGSEPASPNPIPPENTLEKVRSLLQARSEFLQEAIIYAVLPWEDQSLPVEILELAGEAALVRALPRIQDGKLIPQFPFPGKKSLLQVLASSLTDVTIYR